MEPLSYEGFKTLALASKRAFHLEQRDSYNVAAEDEPFGRWLGGDPDDYAWHRDWLNFLRQATAAGVAVQRVRLASVPHSDYIRWGLDVSPLNFEAGEDTPHLPPPPPKKLEPPDGDHLRLGADTGVSNVFFPPHRSRRLLPRAP